jgi:arginine decarboxylase
MILIRSHKILSNLECEAAIIENQCNFNINYVKLQDIFVALLGPTFYSLHMKISLNTGVGHGPTKLAAFDSALRQAGVANYNLLALSSILPAGSEIVESNDHIKGQWGDRLYVVMAEERIDTPNAEAWAGIGWVQDPASKKGLFVEHHGASKASVKKDIEDSLASLIAGRPDEKFGPVHMRLQGVMCEREPVCALVIAAYQAEGWE